MENNQFESLSKYIDDKTDDLIFESFIHQIDHKNGQFLFEEGEGVFGNIMDRALSFIPRAARFKRAQKEMVVAIRGYKKRVTRTMKTFMKSMEAKIDMIDKRYTDMMNEEIKKLLAADEREEAGDVMELFLKEIEQYKTEQFSSLKESITKIFNKYDAAVNKRIESPGFILNVELSEKGKETLGAKWEELVAKANIQLDETKTQEVLTNKKMKRFDEIIGKAQAFVRFNKRFADVELLLNSAVENQKNLTYDFHTHFISSRIAVLEKGVYVSQKVLIDENDTKGEKKFSFKSSNQANNTAGRQWTSQVKQSEIKNNSYYITAYVIFRSGHELLLSPSETLGLLLSKGGQQSTVVDNCGDPTKKNVGDTCTVNSLVTGGSDIDMEVDLHPTNVNMWKVKGSTDDWRNENGDHITT